MYYGTSRHVIISSFLGLGTQILKGFSRARAKYYGTRGHVIISSFLS